MRKALVVALFVLTALAGTGALLYARNSTPLVPASQLIVRV